MGKAKQEIIAILLGAKRPDLANMISSTAKAGGDFATTFHATISKIAKSVAGGNYTVAVQKPVKEKGGNTLVQVSFRSKAKLPLHGPTHLYPTLRFYGSAVPDGSKFLLQVVKISGLSDKPKRVAQNFNIKNMQAMEIELKRAMVEHGFDYITY